MNRMSCAVLAAVVLWSGAAFADEVGNCITTTKDGNTMKTTIYQKGGKTLIESEVGKLKTKAIKDGPNVLLVMDDQKMCMKSPTAPPMPTTPPPGSTAPAENPDGSTTKCTWTNATNPDSLFACPPGYAMHDVMGR
jgi:hypothetical protein